VVRRLAASGGYVITGAKDPSAEIEELARDQNVAFVGVDLADPDGPAQLVATAGDRVDILVNNVGSAKVRPGRIRQSAVQGGRAARDAGQHGQPRPGCH
jgi:NAD(P)-dependent dehydrogenase (short-subunit alcohol dehydrogenase family)